MAAMAVRAEEPRLVDAFGRRLEYLRLSVTARCDFRCRYCLPQGCTRGAAERPLTFEEIGRLVDGFAALGLWKVRLTGGEPTLRRDLVEIVERVAATPGVRHVGMTTNGARLAALAPRLAAAGLSCLNVSVDSLDPARFAAVTGRPRLPEVLAGVEAALAAGISRVKVNVVLLSGLSDEELDRFLAWTRDAPLSVRFIELMDVGGAPAFFAENHVPAARVEGLLAERGWARQPRTEGEGPARRYARDGYRGEVGVIAPSRDEVCARCNRLRVSAAGRLKLCLFDRREVPLRHLLQADAQRAELVAAVRSAVWGKPAMHPLDGADRLAVPTLSAIGG
jgi:GTP 3',8-cyclase